MNNSEQWKLDGDCSQCRRQKYCTKNCKAHKDRINTDIRAAIGRTKIGKMMDAATIAMMGLHTNNNPYKEGDKHE